jgi:hypothetical protein
MVLSVPAVQVRFEIVTVCPLIVLVAPVGAVTVALDTVKPVGKVISATPAVIAVSALKLKVAETPETLRLFWLSSIQLLTHFV